MFVVFTCHSAFLLSFRTGIRRKAASRKQYPWSQQTVYLQEGNRRKTTERAPSEADRRFHCVYIRYDYFRRRS